MASNQTVTVDEAGTSFRIRNAGCDYWTVEEFISNQFCGHWHALFTSSHDYCAAYVRRNGSAS